MGVAGQEVKVTAQVVCTVHNADKYIKPESSTVEFTVSGYEKYPTYIYIHMTDNEGKPQLNGWDNAVWEPVFMKVHLM